MQQQFDIAIIGAGPGGYAAALRAAELGKSVALIERDATLGGTCLNRGCIPSKALITATHAADVIRHSETFGIEAAITSIDFGKLRDYRIGVVATMTEGLASLVSARGIAVFRGNAALDAQHVIHVTPSEGNAEVYRFDKPGKTQPLGETVDIIADDVILATGSHPRPIPGEPFRGAIIDSTQALEADTFPDSAVIIGAGAIAIEFASMWNAAGCDVTLLIRKDRVLSRWDRRTGSALTRELKKQGVNIVTNTRITSIDAGDNLGVTVHYTREGEDGESTATGVVALAAIGRDPNTDAAWFDEANIKRDERGLVLTDEYGRTNIDHVWALGDITPGPALAHRAFEQGIVIAESIVGLSPRPVDNNTVPGIVFSTPEAATVGITIDQAKAREDISNAKETVYPMLSNARIMMSGTGGAMSVVSGEKADRPGVPVVLGVHIVAPTASDLIAEAQQVVGNAIPLADAARLIHAHPTFGETFGEALLKADGRPLHTR